MSILPGGASAESVFFFLLGATLRATVVLGLATAVALLLHRRSAGVRHTVWVIAIAAVLAIPFVRPNTPTLEVPVPRLVYSTVNNLVTAEPGVGVPEVEETATAAGQPMTLVSWLVLAWAIGAGILLLRIGGATWVLWRTARKSEPLNQAEWLVLVQSTARELGIRRPVTVLMSPGNSAPVTWGAIYPQVMLPESVRSWTPERRRAVLVHELAHVARMDTTTQVLAQLACAVGWFHPLVWYAAHRLRIERERACDDVVLRRGTLASSYAQDLVDLAQSLDPARLPALAAVSIDRRSQFEARVRSILDAGAKRTPSGKPTMILGALVAGVALVGTTMFRPGVPMDNPGGPDCRIRAVGADVRLTTGDDDEKVATVGSEAHGEMLIGSFDGEHCLSAVIKGTVTFSNRVDDVVALSRGGSLVLRDANDPAQPSARLEEKDGQIVRTYLLKKAERPWAEGQAWFARSLGWVVRDYGFDAERRVKGILDRRGVPAVFEDVLGTRTDGGKTEMLKALLASAQLSAAEKEGVRAIAGTLRRGTREELLRELEKR
jgi:beta-lactamase regulating signal transducer with metallopeptidase domain